MWTTHQQPESVRNEWTEPTAERADDPCVSRAAQWPCGTRGTVKRQEDARDDSQSIKAQTCKQPHFSFALARLPPCVVPFVSCLTWMCVPSAPTATPAESTGSSARSQRLARRSHRASLTTDRCTRARRRAAACRSVVQWSLTVAPRIASPRLASRSTNSTTSMRVQGLRRGKRQAQSREMEKESRCEDMRSRHLPSCWFPAAFRFRLEHTCMVSPPLRAFSVHRGVAHACQQQSPEAVLTHSLRHRHCVRVAELLIDDTRPAGEAARRRDDDQRAPRATGWRGQRGQCGMKHDTDGTRQRQSRQPCRALIDCTIDDARRLHSLAGCVHCSLPAAQSSSHLGPVVNRREKHAERTEDEPEQEGRDQLQTSPWRGRRFHARPSLPSPSFSCDATWSPSPSALLARAAASAAPRRHRDPSPDWERADAATACERLHSRGRADDDV